MIKSGKGKKTWRFPGLNGILKGTIPATPLNNAQHGGFFHAF
jgi:hypothetical protein